MHPLGPLTTRCWVRSLWESLDYCGLHMTVDYSTIPLSRTGDKLLADIFVVQSEEQSRLFRKAAIASKLAGLQRSRNARGLLFLSDMASANGRHIERKWLTPIAEGTRPLSTLHFPAEIPTRADWLSWAKFRLAHLGLGLALDKPL